ncbi:MinD/ParA family ATP-binding protein [Methanotorris igneus]|uniref:Capsular polysaccharide biosynthesis protein n=1 Tax=Methanotorris igneus (strain DSM 5666 / JCM 11834 / Kol 5) TaxID=880724 RepID=F6BDZ1_METIK|nr:MinD/ParA family protein [Methanotorris igneus]AEF96702.1 capsular polysaccharide biosynthesis protein [Methanotorris igneus Kol 5]
MKTITFSIAKGGTGKSVMTANVAAALALKGKKVVILDADIGSRSLTHLFGKEMNKSFIDAIKEDLSIDEILVETDIENLYIITSGRSLEDYFKIEGYKAFEKLEELKRFDYVFIDAPTTTTGIETYLSLGFSEYFVLVLDFISFGPSLQGAINTAVIGRNYLECKPVGFILNKSDALVPESVINDVEKLLGMKCIANIPKNALLEQSYNRKEILYVKNTDANFNKLIDNIVEELEALPEYEKTSIPELLKRIKDSLIL